MFQESFPNLPPDIWFTIALISSRQVLASLVRVSRLHRDLIRPLLYRHLILYVEKVGEASGAQAATLDLLRSIVSGERAALMVQRLELVGLDNVTQVRAGSATNRSQTGSNPRPFVIPLEILQYMTNLRSLRLRQHPPFVTAEEKTGFVCTLDAHCKLLRDIECDTLYWYDYIDDTPFSIKGLRFVKWLDPIGEFDLVIRFTLLADLRNSCKKLLPGRTRSNLPRRPYNRFLKPHPKH